MEDINKEEVKTKRQAFLEKLKGKHPDLNIDDEDALFGSISDHYDNSDHLDEELKGYKKNEEMLVGAFEKNPKIASMFLEMAKGENPFLYLIENFGDEFREALENPDLKEQITERHAKYMERLTKNKEMEEQAKANLTASLDALTEAQTELGYSDEDATTAFENFTQIIDDAIVDKVSKETWIMFLKGLKHDIDVEQANLEGELKGKNAKIGNLKAKQTVPTNIPPQLGGQGEPPKTKKIEIEGALGRYGKGPNSIWDK